MHWFRNRPNGWWVAFACMSLPIAVALYLGQDTNWDLANYHLYNPHAWLSGRYGLDVAPAQVQTWHNPALDVPLYLLVKADMPGPVITLWLTLPAIAALFAGTRLLANLLDRPPVPWEMASFAIVAISAPAMFSTVGSSMNDGFVAAGMVAALAVATGKDAGWRAWLLAGAIAGCTAGLKLSAMAYCIGLAAAALVADPATRRSQRVAALAAGGFLGFLLAYGAWGWRLWEWHGNPFFPYFNQIFQSPDAAAIAWTDERFRPRGLIEVLSVPLRLLMLNRDFSELPVRTPLLLLGLLSICGLLWRRQVSGLPQCHAVHVVSAFFVTSLAVWTVQSGILRYTSPLEVIAASLLVAGLVSIPRARNPVVAAALALSIIAFTVQPNWGRQPFTRHFLFADWPVLPKDSMLVISGGAPLAFFALGLPGDVPIVAISNNLLHPKRCNGLQQRAGSLIHDHRGPMWMLEENRDDRGQLRGRKIARRRYGLVIANACTIMRSTFGQIRMCEVTREHAAITCTSDGPVASYMRPASK